MPGSRRMLWLAIGVLATIAVPWERCTGGRWNRFCWRIWIGGGGGVNIDLAVRR